MTPLVRLYGLTVRSELALPGEPAPGAEPDVECVVALCGAPEPDASASPVYERHWRAGAGGIRLYRHGEGYLLRFREVVDFLLDDGRVTCFPRDAATDEQLRALFLGPVCALLLELRGIVCLHASAVEIAGRAVAFLAPSGGGKSTLAATFVAAGHALIADDITPLRRVGDRWRAVPGFPAIKLGREMIGRIPGAGRGEPVVPGSEKRFVLLDGSQARFVQEPLPLAAVYVMDPRGGNSRSVERLGPADAFAELLRHGFAARAVEALGLAAGRFGILTDVLRQASVRRLSVPQSLDRLPEVRDRILDDLERSSRPP